MQSDNENNEVPFPDFQYDNDHNDYGGLPRYNYPQNDYQAEINFSPNAYQQEQQQPYYENAPYAPPGNDVYNPAPQSVPMSLDNSARNLGLPSYRQPDHNDDADFPPRQENASYANREDKYKVEDQPNQDNGGDPQKPTTMGENNTESIVKRIINIMLLIFVLGNLIILIALLVYHFGHKDVTLSTLAGALSYISFNLGADPILDVQVKDDGTSCPSGYSSILLGTWPGTVDGCDCPLGLYKRRCSRKKGSSDKYCTSVAVTSPIDMYDWGGSKWCVQRAKIGTQYTKSVNCGSGFIKCSSGICVLSSLTCPVTKVSIQSSGTYKLKVGTNRYVVTENVQGASPVVALAITPNDIPCFSDDYQPAGSTSPYKLINEDETGCSKYGLDSQYSFQVDTQIQGNLFTQNSFPSKVMNLPDYSTTYGSTSSVLSYRKRMNVLENDFCLSIDTETLEKSSVAAEKLNKFMSGTSITAMVIHGILFFIVLIMILSTKSEGKSLLEVLGGSGEIQVWVAPVALLGTLEYIALIVMFAAAKHYRNVMVAAEDYLIKLSATGCFLDSQPREAVSDYHIAAENVAGSLYKYALALFLITTFSVLPSYYLLCQAGRKR